MKIMVFDTETTGTPTTQVYLAHPRQPRLVQLHLRLEEDGRLQREFSGIVKPDGWSIPPKYQGIHGISTMQALENGTPARQVWDGYAEAYRWADVVVAHNIKYDLDIMAIFAARLKATPLRTDGKKFICTMKLGRDLHFKPVNLIELYKQLFGREHEGQHTAPGDCLAASEIFHALIQRSPATQEYLGGRHGPEEAEAFALG